MSIKATFPMFFQTEQKYRSLIIGMLARKRRMAEIKSNHQDFLETIANEKELSQANDDKLKSILDGFVEKFVNN